MYCCTENLKSINLQPGLSGLVAEMIQVTGDIVIQWLTDLCIVFVNDGCIPDDWISSVVLPIYEAEGYQWSVVHTEG